jgi:hypothetical protein
VIVLFIWIPPLRHVRQCEMNDCGIAAAATAACVSYESAAAKSRVKPGKRGLRPRELLNLLRRLTGVRWQDEVFRRFHPVSQFFGISEEQVLVIRFPDRPTCSHYIVVKDGRVYDPSFETSSRIETYAGRNCPVALRLWPLSRREWIRDRLLLVGCALIVFLVISISTMIAAWLTDGFK